MEQEAEDIVSKQNENLKSARDVKSAALEAVNNPNMIASRRQQIIAANCSKYSGKLVRLTKSGQMNSVLRRYFVEGQVMKPSDGFLKQQQGCTDVTRYLLQEAIESIPDLDSIKSTIKARSPLSSDDSKAALSIIDEHFPKEIEVETNKRRRVMIDV